MQYILQILLFLTLVIVASKGAGHLSTRFGQPAVFGEILVGLILGPSLLNLPAWAIFASHAEGFVRHPDVPGVMNVLAEIGVILLMFVAGLETDLEEMRRVGAVAFWAALGGVVLPLFGGACCAHLFGYGWSEGMFMGAVLTATSVSITAQTLMELGSLRSREGSTILGAAVIDDVMGIIVLSLVVAFAGGSVAGAASAGSDAAASTGGTLLIIVVRMALFFALAWLLGRRFLERVATAVSRLRVSEPLMAFVVVVTFAYAWAAEALGGVASITGAYIAGVLFARTSLEERVRRGMHPLTYSFFVPVFFVDIGLQADVRHLGGRVLLAMVVIGVAIAGKVIGCGVSARLAGFSARESYRVGVGMISRGEVGLIVAGYGLAHGIIGNDIFSVMVLMVLVTTMITPLWLRSAFPRGLETKLEEPVYESVAHVERE